MKKKLLCVIVGCMLLAGCSAPEAEATPKLSDTVVSSISEAVDESAVNAIANSVSGNDTESVSANSVEPPTEDVLEPINDAANEPTVILEGNDLYLSAFKKFNRNVEFAATVNFHSTVDDADFYYNSGLFNTENVDYLRSEEWAGEAANPLYVNELSSHYATYVSDVYTCAVYDKFSDEWTKCEDTAHMDLFFDFWASVGISEQTKVIDNITYYSATINCDALPWLCDGLEDVYLEAEVTVWNDTEELRGVRILLPEYTDAEGRVHTDCTYDFMYDICDQASGSPLGFEEAVGLNE